MTLGIASALRNASLDNIAAAIDAGASGGKIKFYDGVRPATNGAATTLLGTVTFAAACAAAAAANGVLTFAAMVNETNAPATGTATWARIEDSNGLFVCDCDVSTVAAGTGDIQLNSTAITAGGIISVTSGSLTAGNA